MIHRFPFARSFRPLPPTRPADPAAAGPAIRPVPSSHPPTGLMPDLFWLAVVLGILVLALGASAQLRAESPVPIEVAVNRVAAALAEGVAISLEASPRDERGVVMVATRLDDAVVADIQQSSAAARELVDAVAARYTLAKDTQRYLIGALIGFSQICADFPPPAGSVENPHLARLIAAFRLGVRAGVESRRDGA